MNRRYTDMLNTRVRIAAQAEPVYHSFERRRELLRAARSLERQIVLANCTIAALTGAVLACVLILTGAL